MSKGHGVGPWKIKKNGFTWEYLGFYLGTCCFYVEKARFCQGNSDLFRKLEVFLV